MAEKRMFSKSIVLSDNFLDMPATSRCLYFTLNMMADDDGFVDNPKSIMRQCNCTEDDMRILIAKSFILAYENGIIVIKDWRINNWIRQDRYQQTTHKEELKQLGVAENGSYKFVDEMTAEEKKTLKIEEKKKAFVKPTVEEIQAYITEKSLHINAETFFDYYESNGWKVGRNHMKDWKATCRQWNARERKNSTGSYVNTRSNVNQVTEEDLKHINF